MLSNFKSKEYVDCKPGVSMAMQSVKHLGWDELDCSNIWYLFGFDPSNTYKFLSQGKNTRKYLPK